MSTPSVPQIDVEAGGAYPAELYRATQTAELVPTLSDIGAAEIEAFHRDGFLAVASAIPQTSVADALAGLEHLVMATDGGPDLQFESWAADQLPQLDATQRMDVVRKLMWFVDFDDRLLAVAEQPELLAVVHQLLGSEHVRLFQDMALLKPPGGGREKPWHQDKAYFNIDPTAPVVGVWIALDRATVDNGCMHVIPGSHRQGPVVHFRRRDWQICDDQVDLVHDMSVPLPVGGALIFDGLIHHGTPANHTATRRRALQFHYRLMSQEEVTEAEHLAVFGSEGKDVTC